MLEQELGVDQRLHRRQPLVHLQRHQAEDQDDGQVDVAHHGPPQVAAELIAAGDEGDELQGDLVREGKGHELEERKKGFLNVVLQQKKKKKWREK